MKHEPTAVTIAGIHYLMDLELKDLNAADIQGADRALSMLCGAADGIRDELDEVFLFMREAGAILDGGEPDPERLHGQFTEIYRDAVQAAGMAVRLAAIARQGIIQSETMNRIERAEPQKGGGEWI